MHSPATTPKSKHILRLSCRGLTLPYWQSAIEELAVVVRADGTAYAATAGAGPANSAVRALLAFSDDQLSAPSELAYHAPSNLAERGDSASLIYITHPDFLDSIEPLKRLRESEGHSVVVVTTDQHLRCIQLRRAESVRHSRFPKPVSSPRPWKASGRVICR
jgi:hypothetical protein